MFVMKIMIHYQKYQKQQQQQKNSKSRAKPKIQNKEKIHLPNLC